MGRKPKRQSQCNGPIFNSVSAKGVQEAEERMYHTKSHRQAGIERSLLIHRFGHNIFLKYGVSKILLNKLFVVH